MSLEITLQNAISGLQTSQRSLQVISNNIANVNVEGYTRKTIEQSSRVISGRGYGVELALVSRDVDEGILRQLRREQGTLEKLTVRDSFLSQINVLFGRPEDNNSITHLMADLGATYDALAVTPETGATQFQTVKAAMDVFQDLKRLSNQVQRLRAQANTQITAAITEFNSAMETVVDTNLGIIKFIASRISTANLEDQRDIALSRMADLMDITYFAKSNGSVTVFTGGGNTLISGQKQALSYTMPASMAATVEYTPTNAANYIGPGNSGYPVGSVPGIFVGMQEASTDITSTISDGKLKGLLDIRDRELPALQAQLDELGEKLKNEINKIHNQGSGFPPATGLTGDRYIEAGGTFSATGDMRIGIVDADGVLQEQQVFTLSSYTTHTALVAALNGMTNMSATINSTGKLVLTGQNNLRIAINELTSSVSAAGDLSKGFSDFFGLNNFISSKENYSRYRSNFSGSRTASVVSIGGTLQFSGNDGTAWTTNVTYLAGDSLDALVTKINAAATPDPLSGENITARVISDGSGFRIQITDAEGDEFAIVETGGGSVLTDTGLRTDVRGISTRLSVRTDIQGSTFYVSRGALQSNTYSSAGTTTFTSETQVVNGAGGAQTLTFSGKGLTTTVIAYDETTDTPTSLATAINTDPTLQAANITASVIVIGSNFFLKVVDADANNYRIADSGTALGMTTTQGVTIGDGSVARDMAAMFESTVTFLAAPADGSGLARSNTTLADYSAGILASNSAQVEATRRDLGFQESLAIELFNKHSSISSVNMDEELANMIIFEQAYLAAARMITTTNEMFKVLADML